MKKLTNVEAQRVMAVLGETLDKLNYISYVPIEKDQKLVHDLTEHRFDTISGLLHKLYHLEEVYLALMNEESSVDALKRVYSSIRNLCRELKESPLAVEVLYDHKSTRSSPVIQLLSHLSLITDLTFTNLSTSVEDVASKVKVTKSAQQRQEMAEEEGRLLQEQLSETLKSKEDTLSLLDMQAKKLFYRLTEMNKDTSNDLSSIEVEMNGVLEEAFEEYTTKMNDLKSKKVNLENEMNTCVENHREEELMYRKRKTKLGQEYKNTVDKNDVTLVQLVKSIESVHKQYKEERVQFDRLNEHFTKLDEEQHRIHLEEKAIATMKSKQLLQQNLVDNAATRIQKIIRGYISRKRLKSTKTKRKSKK